MATLMLRPADFIYVAFPDKPMYLQRQTLKNSGWKTTTQMDRSEYLNNRRHYIITNPITDTISDFQKTYIQSAVESCSLYRKATTFLDKLKQANVSHTLQFSENIFANHDIERDYVARGVCVSVPMEDNVEEGLIQLTKEENATLTVIEMNAEIRLKIRGQEMETLYRQVPRDCIPGLLPKLPSAVSPIFAIPEISPVFHSYNEARAVLEKFAKIPEIRKLLDITDKQLSMGTLKERDQTLKHPFIVVEGMDGTGKSTLTKRLAERMNAQPYVSPPPQIHVDSPGLRQFFIGYPEIVQRAYYVMGNYISARDVISECQTQPVVIDRFWHSSVAYGIANETSSADLPEKGNDVFKWPKDLLRPTIVLFLTVTEDVRKHRLSGRGGQATFEEKSLDKDEFFRQRLCDSYRRMSDPACVEIDASGSKEAVLNKAIDALQERNIQVSP